MKPCKAVATARFIETLAVAEAGVAAAQALTGLNYEQGLGVRTSIPDALLWFRLAAEAGDSMGQYCLGRFCSRGLGML